MTPGTPDDLSANQRHHYLLTVCGPLAENPIKEHNEMDVTATTSE